MESHAQTRTLTEDPSDSGREAPAAAVYNCAGVRTVTYAHAQVSEGEEYLGFREDMCTHSVAVGEEEQAPVQTRHKRRKSRRACRSLSH
jgi:hypothetical protein